MWHKHSDSLSWSQGHQGKGYLLYDGVVKTWNVDPFQPTDQRSMWEQNREESPIALSFEIDPDGGVVTQEPTPKVETIVNLDSRLYDAGQRPTWEDDWDMGKFEPKPEKKGEPDYNFINSSWHFGDYQGWTNWETWHTALMMDNEYEVYEKTRKMMEQGCSVEKLRDYLIGTVVGPYNRQQIEDAKEWNETPYQDRRDHGFDDLMGKNPEAANFVMGIGDIFAEDGKNPFGPDLDDTDPELMEPEKINWQEIWDHLYDELEGNNEHEREHERLRQQGLTFAMPGHQDETNQMLDAWLKHHGVMDKDQQTETGGSAEHHTKMQVPIEHLPMNEGHYSPETYAQWQQQGYGEPRVREWGWETLHDIQKGRANEWQTQRMQEALQGQGYTPEQIPQIMRQRWLLDPNQNNWINLDVKPPVNPDAPGDMTLPEHWSKQSPRGYHYHPFTGKPCTCQWGQPKAKWWEKTSREKTSTFSSQAIRQIRNQNQKVFRDEAGQQFLKTLDEMIVHHPDAEGLVPWLASRYKEGEVAVSPAVHNPETGEVITPAHIRQYTEAAQNGRHPEPSDWDNLAYDYLNFPSTPGRGYGYQPQHYKEFHEALENMGHEDVMHHALQRNLNWDDPSHQYALQQHWNNYWGGYSHPLDIPAPQEEDEPTAPVEPNAFPDGTTPPYGTTSSQHNILSPAVELQEWLMDLGGVEAPAPSIHHDTPEDTIQAPSVSPSQELPYFPPANIPKEYKQGGLTRNQYLRQMAELEQKLGPDKSRPHYQFDNGWSVVAPKSQRDVRRVGELMGNCWQRGTTGSGDPYVLRDPDGIPRIAWNVTRPHMAGDGYIPKGVDPFQPVFAGGTNGPAGHNNSEPKPEHWDMLREWADAQSPAVKMMHYTGGQNPEFGSQYNLGEAGPNPYWDEASQSFVKLGAEDYTGEYEVTPNEDLWCPRCGKSGVDHYQAKNPGRSSSWFCPSCRQGYQFKEIPVTGQLPVDRLIYQGYQDTWRPQHEVRGDIQQADALMNDLGLGDEERNPIQAPEQGGQREDPAPVPQALQNRELNCGDCGADLQGQMFAQNPADGQVYCVGCAERRQHVGATIKTADSPITQADATNDPLGKNPAIEPSPKHDMDYLDMHQCIRCHQMHRPDEPCPDSAVTQYKQQERQWYNRDPNAIHGAPDGLTDHGTDLSKSGSWDEDDGLDESDEMQAKLDQMQATIERLASTLTSQPKPEEKKPRKLVINRDTNGKMTSIEEV